MLTYCDCLLEACLLFCIHLTPSELPGTHYNIILKCTKELNSNNAEANNQGKIKTIFLDIMSVNTNGIKVQTKDSTIRSGISLFIISENTLFIKIK